MIKHLRTTMWAGALLAPCLALGLGHSSPATAQEVASLHSPLIMAAASYADAQGTWKEIVDNTQYLDGLIAQKKLSEVHEAAFNLRDSVRMLRGQSTALPAAPQTRLETLIVHIDGLANELDESGDKNDLRGTIANLRKVHLALDGIAALFPRGTLAPIGAVKATGPVKDPVCRMTVDPATAPGKVAYAGQTYYFCSVGDAAAFQKAPAKYAALYEAIAFGKPKTFALSLATDERAHVGKPELLTFAVRENGSAHVVKDFQLVHEKLMHLIVVSDDLSYFSHEHPEIGADGRFRLRWTFPRAGRYFLFSDFTPGDGLNQILRTQITVDGARPRALPHLVPDHSLSKVVDGYTVTVQPTAPLVAGKQVFMTYTIERGGMPVTDMEPYLGASGHLMAINQNGRDIVHTHTVGAGGAVSNAMATKSGPRFTYDLTVSTPGLTKVWAQFQRGGKVLTVPFTFQVKAPGTKVNRKPSAVLTASQDTIGAVAPGATAHAPANQGIQSSARKSPGTQLAAQNVTLTLPQDYKSGAATVQAGKPVALTFYLKEDTGCGNSVSVPVAKWNKTLKVGEKVTLVYTPQHTGALVFECGMGMYKGTLTVK